MKVFGGKKAAEDYMSSHTLAFSTPELTLMRYSFWLGDMVPDPADKSSSVPRLYTYVEEKDFEPVNVIDDETYVPTGAVKESAVYGNTGPTGQGDGKFCHECGKQVSPAAKFCTECGTVQQD